MATLGLSQLLGTGFSIANGKIIATGSPASVTPVAPTGQIVTQGTTTAFANNVTFLIIRKTVGSPTAVTLPTNPIPFYTYTIKDGKGDSSSNPISIYSYNGPIDGLPNYLLSQDYASINVTFDGTQWNLT